MVYNYVESEPLSDEEVDIKMWGAEGGVGGGVVWPIKHLIDCNSATTSPCQ